MPRELAIIILHTAEKNSGKPPCRKNSTRIPQRGPGIGGGKGR